MQNIDPMLIGALIGLGILLGLGAVYHVTFRMVIPKPRGQDLEVTHTVKNIEADSADQAMKKAYKTLTPEQKSQVTGVYLKQGKHQSED